MRPQQQGSRNRIFKIPEPTRTHRPRQIRPHLAQELVDLGDVESREIAGEITQRLREPHRDRLLGVASGPSRLGVYAGRDTMLASNNVAVPNGVPQIGVSA